MPPVGSIGCSVASEHAGASLARWPYTASPACVPCVPRQVPDSSRRWWSAITLAVTFFNWFVRLSTTYFDEHVQIDLRVGSLDWSEAGLEPLRVNELLKMSYSSLLTLQLTNALGVLSHPHLVCFVRLKFSRAELKRVLSTRKAQPWRYSTASRLLLCLRAALKAIGKMCGGRRR